MNRKLSLLLLGAVALTSCAKTEKLYTENEYNSPVFDMNYYREKEKIDEINVSEEYTRVVNADNSVQKESDLVKIGGVQMLTDKGQPAKWGGLKEDQFGYSNNLSKTEKKFNYGVTSKLFDGRVRCEGYYQKSRVQLDKSGFAMYFPKTFLKQAKYLAFACRGGTDFPQGEEFAYSDLKINVEWTFYIHVDSSTYKKVTYLINGAKIPVDNGGNTALISFTPVMEYFTELYDATAMSFKWSSSDPRLAERNVTDDCEGDTAKEKHHLALMLYEIFIGDSIWG